MNRNDRLNLVDELLNEAEAYDASLRGIGLPPADFVDKHSDLAAVFRLLKDVFESPRAGLAENLKHSYMPLPASLGHFRIVSVLGQGGFLTVYRRLTKSCSVTWRLR